MPSNKEIKPNKGSTCRQVNFEKDFVEKMNGNFLRHFHNFLKDFTLWAKHRINTLYLMASTFYWCNKKWIIWCHFFSRQIQFDNCDLIDGWDNRAIVPIFQLQIFNAILLSHRHYWCIVIFPWVYMALCEMMLCLMYMYIYPGKGVTPSSTPRCSSYWKRKPSCPSRLRSQTTTYIYIYTYIYGNSIDFHTKFLCQKIS